MRRKRHRTLSLISASVGDQNGTSHGPLWVAARAAAVQPTRLGHPRFLDAVGAQTADFNEVRSPKNLAIVGLTRLNFLSVTVRSQKEGLSAHAARVLVAQRRCCRKACGIRLRQLGFQVGLVQ
jgi:hypothetical protein